MTIDEERKIKHMIHMVMPYAVYGSDYTLKDDDGKVEIKGWNTETLGNPLSLNQIHDMYMRIVAKKKAVIPSYDDSDPMEEKETQNAERARYLIVQPEQESFIPQLLKDGTIVKRVR